MALASDRARSDLDILRKAQRSKLVVLGAMLTGIVGVAVLTRGGPIGKSDEPSSVFVVRSGDARFGPALRGLGFTVVEGDLDYFVTQAAEHQPDFEGSDVEKTLNLADWSGHAFVAFESPHALGLGAPSSFSSYEITLAEDNAPVDASTPFAVVSVGNYGFPHMLTTPRARSGAHVGHELDLLTALFQQHPLREAADEAAKSPHEIFALRTRLQAALERLDEITAADETMARIQENTRRALTDEDRGAGEGPRLLGALDESVNPVIALADGSILTVTRSIDIRSRNGLTADIDLGRAWEFKYLPPGARDPEARATCSSLYGGAILQQGQRPRFRWSAGGEALLIDDGTTPRVFTLAPASADAPPPAPCSFVDRGTVPHTRGDRRNLGIPNAQGVVARAFQDGDTVVITASAPGGEVIELARAGASLVEFGSPVWLDERHVAVVGGARLVAEDDATNAGLPAALLREGAMAGVFVLSLDHPGEALLIPAHVVEDSPSIWQIAAVPRASETPALVLTAPASVEQARLYRLDMPAPYAAVFDEALEAAARAEPEAPPSKTNMTVKTDIEPAAEDWSPVLQEVGLLGRAHAGPQVHVYWPGVTAITSLGARTVTDPVVSRAGDTVAAQIDAGRFGYEIGVIDLNTPNAEFTLLTQNELDDHTPMFTADGAQVVFRTRYKIERTTWKMTAGRAVDVP
ncbi:MAG: hypothetical protein H6713_08350 [Myxococcales bacterium]|nr:hypothetical protein [Myxococcales bacterium]